MENQSHSTESNDNIKHEPAVSTPIGSEFHYAGFWMRFWAYLLDLAVVASLNSLLIKPIFHLAGISRGDGFFLLYDCNGYYLLWLFCFNDQVFWTNAWKDGVWA